MVRSQKNCGHTVVRTYNLDTELFDHNRIITWTHGRQIFASPKTLAYIQQSDPHLLYCTYIKNSRNPVVVGRVLPHLQKWTFALASTRQKRAREREEKRVQKANAPSVKDKKAQIRAFFCLCRNTLETRFQGPKHSPGGKVRVSSKVCVKYEY
jgi:hypothetical protein